MDVPMYIHPLLVLYYILHLANNLLPYNGTILIQYSCLVMPPPLSQSVFFFKKKRESTRTYIHTEYSYVVVVVWYGEAPASLFVLLFLFLFLFLRPLRSMGTSVQCTTYM